MILLLCPFNAFADIQTIAEIQGEKQISAFNNREVTVRGIVTARVRNGFFVQTPDDQIDDNPKTSEAIFVFTGKEPNEAATVGNLVEVTGLVSEFVPKAEPVTFPLTEIRAAKSSDEIKIVSKNNQLPKPFVLTAVDFTGANANAKHEALERYEAMRVKATALTTVAPTGGRVDEKNATATSDGVFYAVLTGTPRPFRKPGAEFFETADLDLPLSVPVFDGNPQLLRVDSDAQLGAAALDVAANATIKNLVGVLDYSYRTWTILPDPNGSPVILNNAKATAVVAAKPSEFTIASFNLERFFDDADDPTVDEPVLTKNAWNNRLQKASLVIHEYLKTPDVLALVEVENLPTLQKLANKINSDAAANGKNDFRYAAFLLEGNDDNGIDTGFLINTRRVQVWKVEQIGKSEFYKRQSDDRKVPLFDRPPSTLR